MVLSISNITLWGTGDKPRVLCILSECSATELSPKSREEDGGWERDEEREEEGEG